MVAFLTIWCVKWLRKNFEVIAYLIFDDGSKANDIQEKNVSKSYKFEYFFMFYKTVIVLTLFHEAILLYYYI